MFVHDSGNYLMMSRFAVAVLAALISPALVQSQIVRGTITERASGETIPGTLVTLEPASALEGSALSVLSSVQGEYALRAVAAGRYRVTAKRIGVARYVSEVFELGVSETRRLDIVLEAVMHRLPEVRVVDLDVCVNDESQRQQIAALWDEARTVLTAAEISLRDRLFEAQITRYVRGLHPRTLRVLEESWGERKGVMERPFVSLGGDSLSRIGYSRKVGEYDYYYAPDAEVLLSKAFRQDHCYRVVQGGRGRNGLIGIGFEPAPSRKLPDVQGTLWMDRSTFELRFAEFRYTKLPDIEGADRMGGEVHFGKLANGAWVTTRWFMRFPQYARPVAPVDAYSSIPSVIVRPTVHRLLEEGGMVFTTGLRLYTRPATITGVVLDSAGRPFPGTTIRLSGTPFATQSGPRGEFRIDSLPGSRLALLVEHPSHAQFGMLVGEEAVELHEGAVTNVTIRAPKIIEFIERLCEEKLPKDDNGILRVLVIDSVTSRPLPNLRVWLRWSGRYTGSMARPETLRPSRVGGTEATTDANGAVTFCDVPGDVKLVFSALRPDARPAADSTDLRVARRELKVSTVKTRRP